MEDIQKEIVLVGGSIIGISMLIFRSGRTVRKICDRLKEQYYF